MVGEPERRSGPEAPRVGQYLGYGLSWTASTLLFLLAGRKLDGWLETEPLFTLLGALIGAAAGFWSMYFHLVVQPRRRAERERQEGDR